MFDPSRSLKKMLGKNLQVPRMMTGVKGPNDWDGDGISNKRDCQPRNLIRQDFQPLRVNISGRHIWIDMIKENNKILEYWEDHDGAYWSDKKGNVIRNVTEDDLIKLGNLATKFKKYRGKGNIVLERKNGEWIKGDKKNV